MTVAEPTDVWVPVPLRWRHVQPGDVIAGHDGRLWHIAAATALRKGDIVVIAYHGDEQHSTALDPDEVAHVLVPVTERDAVELTREALGSHLVARRST